MATDDELRRMHNALGVVLRVCIQDRRPLARKDAEHLRADLERLQQSLAEAMRKRGLP